MFTRKKREGFTIVELVIVIAVIGILTAVLVPTFVNLSENAKNASDETLVRNLNTALSIKRVDEGKNETMYDAYLDAKSAGYDLDVIRANRAGRTLVWDQDADEFLTIDDSGNPQIKSANYTKSFTGTMHYWKVAEGPVENSQYSLYIKGDDYVEDIVANYGIDVGRNASIQQVTFQHTSEPALDVKVRTYSKDCLFIVNGLPGEEGDTVHHYAYAKSATINSIGNHSYHEHGQLSGEITLKQGRVVLEKEAEASAVNIVATASEISSGEVKVAVENSAKPNIPIFIDEEAREAAGDNLPSESVVSVDPNMSIAIGQNGNYVQYETFAEGVKLNKLQNGDVVYLLKDISETPPNGLILTDGQLQFTIDLQGHEITLGGIGLLNIDLTIKNGTINVPITVFGAWNDVEISTHLTIGRDCTLAFLKEVADYPITVYGYREHSNDCFGVVIDVYGTIKGRASVFFHGNIGNTSSSAMMTSGHMPKLNVYEGALVSGQIAMNGLNQTNIYGGTVRDDSGATIAVKRGTLNVYGGSIVYSGEDYIDPSQIEGDFNGSETTAAAIGVTSTYNYAGAISVNISGGSIITENGHALVVTASVYNSEIAEFTSGAVDININGGDFKSGEGKAALYVRDTLEGGFITGGSFDTEPDNEWVASGHSKTDVNGTWIVA